MLYFRKYKEHPSPCSFFIKPANTDVGIFSFDGLAMVRYGTQQPPHHQSSPLFREPIIQSGFNLSVVSTPHRSWKTNQNENENECGLNTAFNPNTCNYRSFTTMAGGTRFRCRLNQQASAIVYTAAAPKWLLFRTVSTFILFFLQ